MNEQAPVTRNPLGHPYRGRPAAYWGALGAAGLMIVGSFGPWARAFIVTVSGVDGDGWFVVGAAVVALIALVRWRDRLTPRVLLLAMVMGGVGLGVVVYDGRDIVGDQSEGGDSLFGDVDLVQPGWGLFAAGIGSAALIVCSLTLLWLQRRQPPPTA